MGKIDAVICEYIADNERIADLCNGLYFQGKRIVLHRFIPSVSIMEKRRGMAQNLLRT